VDIAAPEGTEVRAAEAGTVLHAGALRGYGNVVILDHGGGLRTVYAHNRENLVRAGARVGRGQTIARVGQTGRATGPHLHFEVREDEIPADPLRYLEVP
jgi:murein DD-endopeptidase MepM/ murein hydrolase activator NlpD